MPTIVATVVLAAGYLDTGCWKGSAPWAWVPPSNALSIECVDVGGWLAYGDAVVESKADFFAVVVQRLIRARTRAVSHERSKTRISSVWALACHDSVPRGHAGVGLASLHGASPLPSFLTLPPLSTVGFQEFFCFARVELSE